MYQYCRKEELKDLSADGEGNILVFKTPFEIAKVELNNTNTIVAVTHTDLKTGEVKVIKEPYHIVVGESNWTRDVFHYLKPNDKPHLQLRLGLTVHRGEGTWSSLPHDFENKHEPGFEELFFYLLEGKTQRAIQVGRGVWMNNTKVDAVWPVNNREFGVIPMGYHPVVGEPGVKVSYVWAYLVKHKHWEKI